MASEVMTDTLRRARWKVLEASFEEARERFRPERLALYIQSDSGELKVEKTHGFSQTQDPVLDTLLQRCEQSRERVLEALEGRMLLLQPVVLPGCGKLAAVFYLGVPEERSSAMRDDLLAVEVLAGRAAAETAILTKRLLVDKPRVLPAPDQVDTWSGVRRAGLEAFRAGVHDMALSFLERALLMAEEWGPCPELATSLNDHGEVLRANERMNEAAEEFQRGISILEQGRLDREMGAVPLLNNYAGVLYAQGEPSEAEGYYRRALEIMTETGQESRATPAILANLGVISKELGDPVTAQVWLQQAVAAAARIFGEDHPNTAKCRQKLESLLHSHA